MTSLATMISSSSRCETLRYSRTGNWMFCRTVSEENSAPCWNRIPQRRSTARRAAALAASSHSDRGEKDRKHAVHDDDEEDSFHHRRRRVLPERLGAALHRKAFDAGDDPYHRRHDRCLDDADRKMIDRDRVAQPQQER